MAKSITYRFEVTATMPLAESKHDVDYYTEEQAISAEHRRQLVRWLFELLKNFDCGCKCECDVDLLDFSVEEDDDAPMTSDDARDAEAHRQWKENR